jgi:hypothetical protein
MMNKTQNMHSELADLLMKEKEGIGSYGNVAFLLDCIGGMKDTLYY